MCTSSSGNMICIKIISITHMNTHHFFFFPQTLSILIIKTGKVKELLENFPYSSLPNSIFFQFTIHAYMAPWIIINSLNWLCKLFLPLLLLDYSNLFRSIFIALKHGKNVEQLQVNSFIHMHMNFAMNTILLGILLKWKLWFSKSEVHRGTF